MSVPRKAEQNDRDRFTDLRQGASGAMTPVFGFLIELFFCVPFFVREVCPVSAFSVLERCVFLGMAWQKDSDGFLWQPRFIIGLAWRNGVELCWRATRQGIAESWRDDSREGSLVVTEGSFLLRSPFV